MTSNALPSTATALTRRVRPGVVAWPRLCSTETVPSHPLARSKCAERLSSSHLLSPCRSPVQVILRYHWYFKYILMTLAFAASLHTTSAATANTTILVGTEDNIHDLVYAITFNGKDEIDFLTQTNVLNKAPGPLWLALHPTDKTKLLVVYEGSDKYQNFKIGQDGQLTAELEFTAQDAGVEPAFGIFG
jgi:hypothetical protein